MDLRLHTLPSILTALAAATLLVACDTITYSDDDAPLQTDRRVYDLRQDEQGNLRVEIPFTYHNTTGRAVYLVNCAGAAPPSLQKWERAEWRTVWTPILPACLSQPIVVPHRAVYRDTLHIVGVPPWSSLSSHFETRDPAGIYRLLWAHPVHDYDFDDPPSGTLLPLRDRISNGFELRAP